MVGSISCLMRALQEAFINKTPLPQFLPSARIAHRRLINKVRQTLRIRYPGQISSLTDETKNLNKGGYAGYDDEENEDNDGLVMKMNRRWQGNTRASPREYVLKEKFLSWNASSAASEEIIEYIEELLNLTKILVGVNEFKYGFLSRPLYEDWAAEAVTGFDDFINGKSKPKKAWRNTTPFDGTSVISEGNESLQSSNSNESQISPDSTRSYEPERPMAYEQNDISTALNLSRIASRKAGQNSEGLPKTFRNRAFSIASTSGQLSSLSRHSTLGNADPNYLNDESSDDDLPLALKMVLSHMKDKKD
ncbi:AIS_HP2_G0017840.mRNA.1.CDS.1 [Saccharomyces cerevisiae]|nr:AIS_HP2_G0017840.mRNA.1.CDS.1 [Saccharomyces cerevisiae]CAI6502571.1 AIS_HP2_G0017840.mRNA.1.CDS.1 [Saccharomyces cerevisiae]